MDSPVPEPKRSSSVTPARLVKPMSLAFRSTGVLSRRAGVHHKQTPETPIKAPRRFRSPLKESPLNKKCHLDARLSTEKPSPASSPVRPSPQSSPEPKTCADTDFISRKVTACRIDPTQMYPQTTPVKPKGVSEPDASSWPRSSFKPGILSFSARDISKTVPRFNISALETPLKTRAVHTPDNPKDRDTSPFNSAYHSAGMDHVPYAVLFSSQPIMIDTHFFKQVFVPLGINDYFATFHVVSKIGQGAFGDVYSVRKDSRLFALKKAIKPFTGYKDAYYIFT